MSFVSGLLQVMTHHEADELVLRLGSPPSYSRAGVQLKVLMRPLGPDRHAQLLRELVDEQRHLELVERGEIAFEHLDEERGTVLVEVKDASSPRLRFSRLRPTAPAPAAPSVTPVVLAPRVVEAEAAASVVEAPSAKARRDVPQSLQALLDHAAERGASDLHLATGEPAVVRVDGRLVPLGDRVHDVDGIAAALLDAEARAHLPTGSVDRSYAGPTGERYRVNVYRCDQGLALAVRILRRGAPDLDTLHLPPRLEEHVQGRTGAPRPPDPSRARCRSAES